MAILTEPERFNCWAGFMSDMSAAHTEMPLLKQDLRTKLDAIDSRIDAVAAVRLTPEQLDAAEAAAADLELGDLLRPALEYVNDVRNPA